MLVRPHRWRILAGAAACLFAVCSLARAEAIYQLSGVVQGVQNDIGGSGVDISGLVSVNDPWQITFSFDPALSDSNGSPNIGRYRQVVNGFFLQGSAGNFAWQSTNQYLIDIEDEIGIPGVLEGSYAILKIASIDLGMTGNFPLGADPNFSTFQLHLIDFDNDMLDGDALIPPPDPASPVVDDTSMFFEFKNSSGDLVAQFFGRVDLLVVVPEPSSLMLWIVGSVSVLVAAIRRRSGT